MLIFDIETRPRDLDVILDLKGPFDPSTVKLGNLGPEKAAEKIEKARNEYEFNLRDKAALSPLTGEVVVIGYKYSRDDKFFYDHGDEKEILTKFWDHAGTAAYPLDMCGFNIKEFDIPFIIGRSFVHGIKVPKFILGKKYLPDGWIDLKDCFKSTSYENKHLFGGSLNTLCKHLGLPQKTEESGKEFGNLWDTDRERAIKYLEQDINMTEQLAKQLGVI
jgi:DNA polymerase elongation subunit (family B)